nr:hypothetical protein [Tanacetum cinerariifolium]
PIPPVPVAPAGQQVAPEILAAHTAWQAEQELLQTTRDFHSCRQEERKSVQKGNKHKKSHSQKGAKGQNQGKEKFASKPKIPPPPKRENLAKDSICHDCGEIGHWKRNCPQYLAELMKKKKNTSSGAGGSGIFVIELNTILNRSWIYDTGCGTHICNTTYGLRASRKLKPGALSLYVGDGQREAVEAIGAFYLYHGIIAHRTPPYTPQHNGVS